jgi:ABC-type Mn2+/Zn2+ transport system permease subunit
MLTELLDLPYVQRALLEVALLSIIVGVVGSYVVLRSLSFLTLALSHAIFPGVVLAYILNLNFMLVTMTVGIVVSLLIGVASRNVQVGHNSAIGTIYTGFFALGIVLVSYAGLTKRLSEFLFGRLFGVGWEDIIATGVLVVLILVLFWLTRKEFLLVSFDPGMARAQGLGVGWLETGFLALLAMVVVVSLPAVGNIQIVALLVIPPATARLLTDKLYPMMFISGAISFAGGVLGIYVAVTYNLVPGATVVVALTALFMLAYLFSPRYGLLPLLKAKAKTDLRN